MEPDARKRVLLVEDFTALANALKAFLESSGFEVHTEASGKAAIDYATLYHPDLVVLDLRLPDITGYQVCRALRQQYHTSVMPIIMLTAMDQPVDQLRGFGHGADAYLTKPCEPTELLTTISRLLGQEDSADFLPESN